MKILFVCRGNVGRSQMAEAIFNTRAGSEHRAFSVGTMTRDKDGESSYGKSLQEMEAAKEVLVSLKELGIDASANKVDQLDEQMMQDADIIIAMSEDYATPDFLKNSAKARYWEVPDPKGMNQSDTNKVRDKIIEYVDALIDEIKAGKGV
ncbi:MAG: low molecular weight phosphatase family protein [Candidatus Paceibacterota bacterium]|jgi:protein-tyrosine-phosphatase